MMRLAWSCALVLSRASFGTSKAQTLLPRLKAIKKQSQLDEKAMMGLGQLNTPQREQALRIIVDKIRTGTLPSKLLQEQTLMMYLKRHPSVAFDAFLGRIDQQLDLIPKMDDKTSKIAIVDINKCFMNCFEALKQMNKEEALEKGASLHQIFAYYHIEVLAEKVPETQIMEVLAKAVEFFKSSLSKLSFMMKELTKEGRVKTEEVQDKIDDTAQTYSMALIKLIDAVEQLRAKELEKNGVKVEEEEMQVHEGMLKLVPYLSQSLEFDKLVRDLAPHNVMHLKIKKMYHEMAFQKASQRFDKRKDEEVKALEKRFENNLMQIREEAVEIVEKEQSLQNELKMRDVTVLILGIDFNMLTYKGVEAENIEGLLKMISVIGDLFKEELLRERIELHLLQVMKLCMGYDLIKQLNLEGFHEEAVKQSGYQTLQSQKSDRPSVPTSRAQRMRAARGQR